MKLLLISNKSNENLKIINSKNIVNKQEIYTSQILEIVKGKEIRFDVLVILDSGIDISLVQLKDKLMEFEKIYPNKQIVIFTNNLEIKYKLYKYKVYFQENIRVSQKDYDNFFHNIQKHNVTSIRDIVIEEEIDVHREEDDIIKCNVNKGERNSIFSKMFKKSKGSIEEIEAVDKFKYMSKGISRIVSITGHRGSGVTSTTINLAYEAAKRDLSTIIIDLDIFNRTTNLYFSEFMRQSERDEHIAASLVKCLAKPQDYKNNACPLGNKLWITSLAYDFEDKHLINQFYTYTKLINMLTVFRQSFNLVIIDMPFDVLKQFSEIIPNIDAFALCTHNSQYSIITNLRNMSNGLTNEYIGYLNAKAKLIITKYNDRAQYEGEFFTPDKVSEIYNSDLCEELSVKMPIAGYIRYSEEFDVQIENDIPIVETSNEFKGFYSNILLRIMEG